MTEYSNAQLAYLNGLHERANQIQEELKGVTEPKYHHMLSNELENVNKEIAKIKFPSKKQWADNSYVQHVFSFILQNKQEGTKREFLDEAFKTTAEVLGRDQCWVKEVRSNDYGGMKSVWEYIEKYHKPEKDRMKKNGQYQKPSVEVKSTLNAKVGMFLDLKRTSDRLDEHEERIKLLEREVNILKQQADRQFSSPQEKAIWMRSLGHSYQDIAKHLGKGLRTVKRWCS